MNTVGNERYYPTDAERTFAAMREALDSLGWRVKSTDGFAKAISFTTPMSGFSWGATMSASVIPQGDGSIVRVAGNAKVRVNVTAKGAEFKKASTLLDRVSHHLQQAR